MARIILATFGSYGDLNPFLALGLELKRRGHDPVVATSEVYRRDVEGRGLGFAPVRPDLDRGDLALFARALDRVKGPEVIIREILTPRVRESYSDLERAAAGADLLLSHSLTYAAPVLAEKRNMIWLSVVLQPLMFLSAEDPPVLAPAPWLGALRPLGPAFNRALLLLVKLAASRWGDPVRALRAELGLPRGADPLFDGQYSPYGTLALFSPLYGPPQLDWPENTLACGFPFLDSDIGGKGLDPGLEAFLGAGTPPVVFTLGSAAVMIAGDFFRNAAAAVKGHGVRAILLAGPAAKELTDLPNGVEAFESAPYHDLFPRCAAVVHSGGIGTTAQALRAGVPQMIVPFAHDQFDNAARVARMGAGEALESRNPTGRELAATLSRLLDDDEIKDQAARIGAAIRTENGVLLACDAIEAALRASLKTS
ncbi:MAG: glycosyltransferase [Elusimicrobiota bacterium]|nr:glycosyltransferase [Elusimicrobiota bacterium]